MQTFAEFFDAVLGYCRTRIPDTTYDLFIRDITPLHMENNEAHLAAASDFKKGVIDARYRELLEEGFKSVLGFDVTVVIESEESVEATDLITKNVYTFDNFVVGPTNKLAHAAALAVATNPSGMYNPLFIYGDSGLGKTHILLAIKNEILKSFPNKNVIYVSGEQFTNEIIQAIGIGPDATESFKNRYRSADILLVDDVQFIGGKERTQEEFFHTFDALYRNGNQIVLTSDRPPKDIRSLEERLRTRFEWGLIADIQSPDFEMRSAIIKRKAEIIGLSIPDDVVDFIATKIKSNIRQLEGVVKKLDAYSRLDGIPPAIGVAQNSIKDVLSEQQPIPVTVDKIISEVGRTYNVSSDDIRSTKQLSAVSFARQLSMYIVREVTQMTLENIGEEFGGRNHATVVYALKKIEDRLEKDSTLRETAEDIIKNIRQ